MAEPVMDEGYDAEASYALEVQVRCSACTEMISEVRVVRMLRTKVNLPRRAPSGPGPGLSEVPFGDLRRAGNLT